jgi:hypothetical protein
MKKLYLYLSIIFITSLLSCNSFQDKKNNYLTPISRDDYISAKYFSNIIAWTIVSQQLNTNSSLGDILANVNDFQKENILPTNYKKFESYHLVQTELFKNAYSYEYDNFKSNSTLKYMYTFLAIDDDPEKIILIRKLIRGLFMLNNKYSIDEVGLTEYGLYSSQFRIWDNTKRIVVGNILSVNLGSSYLYIFVISTNKYSINFSNEYIKKKVNTIIETKKIN